MPEFSPLAPFSKIIGETVEKNGRMSETRRITDISLYFLCLSF